MLNVSNISIHFGGRYLFDKVSFNLNKSDRVGLIGRNGTGKSTLLKILCGMESPEDGNVAKQNDVNIGYLPQDGICESDGTVYDTAALAMEEINSLQEEINKIGIDLAERQDYESASYMKLVDRLAEAEERYNMLGGNAADAQVEKVLLGLGFKREDLHRLVKEFSGGWQMRIELAKILLAGPEIILLDEPTNHLDIESIQWLEEFLKTYYGAVVIVSHDRNFLDTVTNRTIEITGGRTYDFKMPYTEFMAFRNDQREQQRAAYDNQQKKIAQTEKFIERFRYKANLATRVQSKVKQLDKIERIQVEETDKTTIRLCFPEALRPGRILAESKELSKRYGNKLVLDNIQFAIERGDKIAFVGRNGEGKSTLSKIIAGIEDYEGDLIEGHNVQLGYFAQHQAEMLSPDSTVFQIIDDAATGEMRSKVRSLLGAFMFSGESVDKKVKVLSGGEKSRLAIAKMLLSPMNLMILDEPTNHFDIAAKDVLKQALLDYKGALIIVSHDRHFLHGLTDKTVYFSDHKLKEYPGDIYEFIEKQKIENLQQLEANSANIARGGSEKPGQAKLKREEKKRYERETGRLRKQVEKYEDEISSLEAGIEEMDHKFAAPELLEDLQAMAELKKEYKLLQHHLDTAMDNWTDAQEKLDNYLEENAL